MTENTAIRDLDAGQFSARVLDWFRIHGRHGLPWQNPASPYRVWVSEIMLQQTQVSTVIPYFNRFMQEFPDSGSLARASQEKVLGYWSGLGYYARARNLHKAALLIHDLGEFPDTVETLCKLPGIGRSTAGAIISIAFRKRAAILDGNVKRVLCRYFGIGEWPGIARVERQLWELSDRLAPPHSTAEYTQAIMDLGATVCTRARPDCAICPLQAGCSALETRRTAEIPVPRPSRIKTVKRCYLLMLTSNEHGCYLNRRPPTGVWGGLWSLPEFTSRKDLLSWCKPWSIESFEWLPEQRHTFSHFHLDYTPVIARCSGTPPAVQETSDTVWQNPRQTTAVALPAPVRELLALVHETDL